MIIPYIMEVMKVMFQTTNQLWCGLSLRWFLEVLMFVENITITYYYYDNTMMIWLPATRKIIIRDAAVLRQQRRSTEGCRHRANRGKGGRTWEDRWEKPWFFQWEKFFISFKSLLTGPLNGPLLKVAILSKKTSKTHNWWFTIKKKQLKPPTKG